MKKGYYKASIITGVTFYNEILDDDSIDILSASDFYESLSNLDDKEKIYTFFPDVNDGFETLEKIEKEFGIR